MGTKSRRLILSFEQQDLAQIIENHAAMLEVAAGSEESSATTESEPSNEDVLKRLLAKVDTYVKYDPNESPVFKNFKNKLLDARQHAFK